MESPRPVWRALRPVLLAAAAATSWLALSASAATADSSSTGMPLPGDAPSQATIAASGQSESGADPSAPVGIPTQGLRNPLVNLTSTLPSPQTVTRSVTVNADSLMASVPIVNKVASVPALTPVRDPVGTMVDSTLSTAAAVTEGAVTTIFITVDTALANVVDAAVTPIGDTFLSPVLESVTDLGLVPYSPSQPVEAVVTASIASQPGSAPAPQDAPQDLPGEIDEQEANALPMAKPTPTPPGFEASLSGPYRRTLSQQPGTAAPLSRLVPRGSDAEDFPAAMVGVPGSSSAAGGNSGGNFQSPWISGFQINLPRLQNVPARGALMQAPSSVSFGPGSSPD